MKGRFIVLEGIDGCGKTTQIDHLCKWLPHSGLMPNNVKLHITREPGGTILGQSLRELLLSKSLKNSPHSVTELLLYAADRAQHVSEIMQPKLEKGDWVISDRYSGSTLAYQGFGRGIDITLIHDLEKISTQGLKPDITLFLQISASKSIERRAEKSKDRIESEGKIFLERVEQGFIKIALENNWVNINANQSQEKVSKDIEKQLFIHFKNSIQSI